MNPSQQISDHIQSQEEWKRVNLEMFRRILHSISPDIEEGWKVEVVSASFSFSK